VAKVVAVALRGHTIPLSRSRSLRGNVPREEERPIDALNPIADLVGRLRGGDPRAAEELFARYAQRLTALAEQHLSRKLATRLDGADVVQSVFRTFFRRSAAGEFRIDTSDELWRLLVQITLQKARAYGRQHTAGVRDVNAEAPGGGAAFLAEAVAHEPGPDEAAALVDQIEELLCGLPALYRDLLQLRLEGHSASDTAARLGVSRRTVHRGLQLLQQRLTRSAGME
jgi:RNA polymerase sigma factor (sigma-70 family)